MYNLEKKIFYVDELKQVLKVQHVVLTRVNKTQSTLTTSELS